MKIVSFGEFVNGREDDFFAAWDAHGFGGVVGVTTGTVPVTWDWFRVKGHDDAEIFSNTP